MSEFARQLALGLAVLAATGLLAIWWRMARRVATKATGRAVLVFVSTGGTCRDPMAKVILEDIWNGRKPAIEVHAVGIGAVTSDRASKAARHVINEMLGRDLLERHRPERLSRDLANRAALILCMGRQHADDILKLFPRLDGRVYPIKPFFGGNGDVEDPYRKPDEMSAEALARYRECATELRLLLTANLDHLQKAISR